MRSETTAQPGRRERKKGETRSRIIDIAMDLFDRQGFEATTVDQIAEKADVAKATLYNYFPSKEAILHGHVVRGTADGLSRARSLIESLPDTRSRLDAVFRNVATWMKANREVYRIYVGYRLQNLLRPNLTQADRSGFNLVVEAVIDAGRQSGELRTDIPLQVLALHLEMMYFGVLICWLSAEKGFHFNKANEQVINLFLQGALKKSTSKG